MKTSLILLAVATLCLPACTTDGSSVSSNTGRGSVAGPSSGWSAGTAGFGTVNRDAGSSIRGSGTSAGTSGSTGTGWIAPTRPPGS